MAHALLGASAIAQALYGTTDSSRLTSVQKENLSALATLASGIASGVSSGSASGAVTGGLAGKNAVENNFLLSLLTPPPPVAGQTTPQTEANAAIAQKLDGVVKAFGEAQVKQCLSGGECPLAAQVAITAIAAMMGTGENGPSHTGNNNGKVDTGPGHTGNNDGQVNTGPNHTGNNQTSGQGATNTGNTSGAPDTGGNTTVTPIPDGPNKDDIAYLALKGKEAQKAAGDLGFDRRIPPQKAPFNSHGQPVYFDGKTYITPGIDTHNVSNGWKMFDKRGERMGTYDSNLNRVKD